MFGIVPAEEAPLLKPLARALQARGSLVPTDHGGLALGGDAKDVLRGDAAVMIALPPKREGGRKARRDRSGGFNPVGDPLFEALRALRRDLAAEAGVPPYVIFHDSTLRDMAALRPKDLAELGQLVGIGTRKLEAYGEAFLAIIRQN